MSKDLNGKADPFVELKYRKSKLKSDVVRKTLNPTWQSPAVITLACVDHAEAKKLKITVMDWDRWSSPDFMGRIKIPVAALVNLGCGNHVLTERLMGDPKRFGGYNVCGTLDIRVNVQAM